MTGPEHYKEAEKIAERVRQRVRSMQGQTVDTDVAMAQMAMVSADLAAAQVHATLALAAATAVVADDERDWRTALGMQP